MNLRVLSAPVQPLSCLEKQAAVTALLIIQIPDCPFVMAENTAIFVMVIVASTRLYSPHLCEAWKQ